MSLGEVAQPSARSSSGWKPRLGLGWRVGVGWAGAGMDVGGIHVGVGGTGVAVGWGNGLMTAIRTMAITQTRSGQENPEPLNAQQAGALGRIDWLRSTRM